MDTNTAVIIIQKWFRSKLSRSQCVISHQSFVLDYEIVLDKQVYNANELYKNLQYSTQVPHTRRELTAEEIDDIITKHNPFSNDNIQKERQSRQVIDAHTDNDCLLTTHKPFKMTLNKSAILDFV